MEIEIIFQLILVTFLGALVGLEREYKKKGAGLQTYSLVSLATCLFTIILFQVLNLFPGKIDTIFNFAGLIQAVAIGLGFIGAGVIFRQPSGIVGLTTAAGLWIAGAIGIAVGAKLYFLAVFSTFLTLLILAGFGLLEEKFFKKE
jgi:putative Mg2+ transporter-C (MgtC) family protein